MIEEHDEPIFLQCKLSLCIPIINTEFSNDQLESFCRYLIPNKNTPESDNSSLLINDKEIKLLEKEFNKLSDQDLVRIYDAMKEFLIKASRENLNYNIFQFVISVTELIDLNLSEEKSKIFATFYMNVRENIRNNLKRIGFTMPRLLDVDWRLDNVIKSDRETNIKQPLYSIKLHTLNEFNKKETIDMSCDVVQLQSLVNQLKDIMNALERQTVISA